MITALATLSLLFTVAPAAQDPAAAPAPVSVRYHDLNLRTAAGQAELDRRIARAVSQVCPVLDIRILHQVQASNRCRKAAGATAATQRRQALAAAGAETIRVGSIAR